jgi:hypothetical protein
MSCSLHVSSHSQYSLALRPSRRPPPTAVDRTPALLPRRRWPGRQPPPSSSSRRPEANGRPGHPAGGAKGGGWAVPVSTGSAAAATRLRHRGLPVPLLTMGPLHSSESERGMRVLEVDVGALNRGLEKAIAGARYPLHHFLPRHSFFLPVHAS